MVSFNYLLIWGGAAVRARTDWLPEGPVRNDRRQRLQRRGPFAAPRFGALAGSFLYCVQYMNFYAHVFIFQAHVEYSTPLLTMTRSIILLEPVKR